MAREPFHLPGDAPTDWDDTMYLSANGDPEGSEKYGYNYLSELVNRSHEAINTLDEEGQDYVKQTQGIPEVGKVFVVGANGKQTLATLGRSLKLERNVIDVDKLVSALYRGLDGLHIGYNDGSDSVLQLNLNVWRPQTSYTTGDIVYSQNLKSYEYLECTSGGITAETFSNDIKNMVVGGARVKENVAGGCTWRKRDIRCRHNIGDVIEKVSTTNPPAYEYLLPLDGRQIPSTNYELLQLFPSGYLPDFRDRYSKMKSESETNGTLIDAGLPNITGTFPLCDDYWQSSANNDFSGAFASSKPATGGRGSTGPGDFDEGSYVAKFSAADSNAVYGNANTVRPKTVVVTKYICFG